MYNLTQKGKKRKKGNAEVFCCPLLSSFLRRVEMWKQGTWHCCCGRDGNWGDALWTSREETWRWGAELCPALHEEGELVLPVNTNNRGVVLFWCFTSIPGVSGYGNNLTGKTLSGTTDSSSMGRAGSPHTWVMGSVQNLNQEVAKLGKKSAFLDQTKLQDCFYS